MRSNTSTSTLSIVISIDNPNLVPRVSSLHVPGKKMEKSLTVCIKQQLHPSQSIAPQDNGLVFLALRFLKINITMTYKMKTTEKHSQLNEFRVGCMQQSRSLVFEWTINLDKDLASEGPLPGSNFSLGDT